MFLMFTCCTMDLRETPFLILSMCPNIWQNCQIKVLRLWLWPFCSWWICDTWGWRFVKRNLIDMRQCWLHVIKMLEKDECFLCSLFFTITLYVFVLAEEIPVLQFQFLFYLFKTWEVARRSFNHQTAFFVTLFIFNKQSLLSRETRPQHDKT